MPPSPPHAPRQPSAARWLLVPVLLALAAYAPLALLPGPFFDGWVYHGLYLQHGWDEVLRQFTDNGRPAAAWLNLAAMRLAGSSEGELWISVAALMAAGAAWHLAFLRTGLFSAPLSALMAALAVVTPGNQIILAAPTVVFVLAHTCFAFGLWLSMEAQVRSGAARAACWVLACVLAVASAVLGEVTAVMLLLYPAMAVLAQAAGRGPQAGPAPGLAALARLFVRRSAPAVFGLLAFAFMFLTFAPVGAEFQSERRISLEPLNWAICVVTFAVTIAVAYAPVFCAFWLAARAERGDGGMRSARREHHALLAMSALAAILVTGPYIAAMRLASPIGWGVRYLQFFGCAMAFLLAAVLSRRDGAGRLTLAPRWIGWIAIALLATVLVRWPLFAIRTVHTDALRAAMAHSGTGAIDVLLVADHTPVIDQPLRDREWTGLFQPNAAEPARMAAIAEPDGSDSMMAAVKLRLRQHFGWAPPGEQLVTPQLIQERVRALESVPLLTHLGDGRCRVVRLDVAAPPLAWHLDALGWYFRSRLGQADAYAQWLAASMQGRYTLAPAAALASCRAAATGAAP